MDFPLIVAGLSFFASIAAVLWAEKRRSDALGYHEWQGDYRPSSTYCHNLTLKARQETALYTGREYKFCSVFLQGFNAAHAEAAKELYPEKYAKFDRKRAREERPMAEPGGYAG